MTAEQGISVRQAELDDYEDVVAFTSDTWADRRDSGDYVPRVFEDWVASDGPRQRTFVADAGDGVAGIAQFVRLSEYEAWAQGMRANPDYRGLGVGRQLAHAGFDWAREHGATVARNMVFSWNVMGLGHSRAVGFEPATEFRWVHPAPDADATPEREVTGDVNAAWRYWQDSPTRDHLRGLALHTEESWALAELTRERLAAARDDGDGLLVVQDATEGTQGFAYRTRTYEREGDDGAEQTHAEYGVADWTDRSACVDVLDAIARDAASVGADRTRVLVPEDVTAVSDVAVTRTEIGDEPDFVMAADLTSDYRG